MLHWLICTNTYLLRISLFMLRTNISLQFRCYHRKGKNSLPPYYNLGEMFLQLLNPDIFQIEIACFVNLFCFLTSTLHREEMASVS